MGRPRPGLRRCSCCSSLPGPVCWRSPISLPFRSWLDALTPASSRWSMPVGGAPTLYLTYDDGPNPTATPALLDVLAREGAVATFFVLDRHLDAETAPMVERMFREGHAVALHSHTRRLMLLTPDALGRTLVAAADRIERLTGHRPCPGVPAARRMAQRTDVRGAPADRPHPGRMGLVPLGLGLVPDAGPGAAGAAVRGAGIRRRHHRDARRPP